MVPHWPWCFTSALPAQCLPPSSSLTSAAPSETSQKNSESHTAGLVVFPAQAESQALRWEPSPLRAVPGAAWGDPSSPHSL